jgi:hypothetical protein
MPVAKGISPEKWGRVTWVMLHGLAHLAMLRPTRARARAARLVVLLMPLLLPCRECRTNLAAHLRTLPAPTTVDAEAVAGWVHGLHNLTNEHIGKPRVEYEEGLDGTMREMAERDEGKLRSLVARATAKATGYILRCLVERRGLAESSARRAAEYEAADAAYRAFRDLAGVVLGWRKNEAAGGKCRSRASSTSSVRSQSRCTTRRSRTSGRPSRATGR